MLELNNITKKYGNKIVLEDLNLKIKEGSFIFIMGESGAGKSTLLNIISLFDNVFSGEYYLNGLDILKNKKNHNKIRNELFGFVFQMYNLIEDLTVYENIVTPLLYSDKSIDKKRIIDLMERFGILPLSDVLAKKLSGGEKQRTAFLRSIVNDPQYIICDEPTGNLDYDNAKQIFSFLFSENSKGKTVIVVSHDSNIISEVKAKGAFVYGLKNKKLEELI